MKRQVRIIHCHVMVASDANDEEVLVGQTNAYRRTLSPFARVLASKLGRKREGLELLRAAGIVLVVSEWGEGEQG